jgi:hypothetical protein
VQVEMLMMIDGILQSRFLIAEGGFDGWGEFVLFLIIMFVSVIGSIIKSISAAAKQKKQGETGPAGRSAGAQPAETWQRRLARKAEEFQRSIESRYQDSRQQAERAPRPEAKGTAQPGKVTIRTGPAGESLMVFEKDPNASTITRQREAREAVAAARRSEAQRLLAAQRKRKEPMPQEPSADAEMPSETIPEPTTAGSGPPLIDYDDPEILRRAILHYEILGKPLACRDPFERDSFS